MSTRPSYKRSDDQWSRICNMNVPDTAMICLANVLRPGRVTVEVPVRQDDLSQMIPDDWRRLQRDSVRTTPLPVADAVWSRLAEKSDPAPSPPLCPPRPRVSGSKGQQDQLHTSETLHEEDSQCSSPRFEPDGHDDSSVCSQSPVLIDEPYAAEQEEGNSSWDEETSEPEPSTPAFDLPCWLDDLHHLMSRCNPATTTKSTELGASRIIREEPIGSGQDSILVTIVEADEGRQESLDGESDRANDYRPLHRKLSMTPAGGLEPIEEMEESLEASIVDAMD